MPASLHDQAARDTLAAARHSRAIEVQIDGEPLARAVRKPFPSPTDWRDHWIYFLMIDRFNNPDAPPADTWERYAGGRQGGTFEGVRQQLGYIKNLGADAIWLTPVLKNRQSPADHSHHGYGIQDFLEVDPRFGSQPENAESELIHLIDEAHARGLYVILDVVINHVGDLFAYSVDGNLQDSARWRDEPYTISWRDADATPNGNRTELPRDGSLSRDADVWPRELQENRWFRRKGKGTGDLHGDFETLKEFATEVTDEYNDKPVWNLLISAYQYVIARFDVDGFRIDTLKHVEREFALTFCNAIREFAFSIGKKNFFIFGETKSDDEALLASYTGRFTSDEEGMYGADATLDFPLQWKLGPVAKGFAPPIAIQDLFNLRRKMQDDKHLFSTHGEASRFFVTFLDNHDDDNRFLYPRSGGDWTRQLTLALGCLFSLQGIPCIYYGTEQGLQGTRELYDRNYDPSNDEHTKPEHVREALWGKPAPFDDAHPLYTAIQALASLRVAEPALRYGRQYFRRVSGNNQDFGFSQEVGGVLAYSRILAGREVVVVANTNTMSEFSGWVVIDARINDDRSTYRVAYSNAGSVGSGTPRGSDVTFYDRDGSVQSAWARRLYVRLAPMELQILTRDGA